jgi:hypothetical protein
MTIMANVNCGENRGELRTLELQYWSQQLSLSNVEINDY